MATIILTLTDTASGGVSIRSDFMPAIGKPITPAQRQALDLIASTRNRWGYSIPANTEPGCQTALMSEHWGDPSP